MRLGEVLGAAARIVRGSPETDVADVVVDSRRAGPGTLFCALPGARADGTAFAADALSRGAAAVLADREIPGGFPLAVAADVRRATALASAAIHRFPAARMTMLGVTGTNGKTTVAYLAEAMVRAAGRRAGLVGTVEWRWPGGSVPASHTTPESVDLQALLARMAAVGTDIVSMEVSSHALAQSRVGGVRYRAAAFTHLTRDHLDYHGDMEAYFEAKARLFREHLAADGTAVLSASDPWARRLHAELSVKGMRTWRFGTGADEAELRVREPRLSLAGFVGALETPAGTRDVRSPLPGLHNVHNALCAAGLALAGGIPLGAVVEALAMCRGAPGRLEPVDDPAGRRVFVDYAHTDDALARVLDALRALSPPGTRLVCVFGCGGDRDRGKRPLMGAAAARRADAVVLTSDNPRTEKPGDIVAEILPGVESEGMRRAGEETLAAGGRGYVAVEDRAEAVGLAVRLARPGDVVLVAGKGHEDCQLVGSEKRHFDDREVARAALERFRGVP